MAKLAKHWEESVNGQEWISIETDVCSTFHPRHKLSQKTDTTNPVLIHSSEVWSKVHRMLKLPHQVQTYASLWNNPAIYIDKGPLFWGQWHSRGIHTIGDLYKDGQFMSYEDNSYWKAGQTYGNIYR